MITYAFYLLALFWTARRAAIDCHTVQYDVQSSFWSAIAAICIVLSPLMAIAAVLGVEF